MKKTTKLTLDRETVRALSPSELTRGRGGLMYYPPPPWPTSLREISAFPGNCRY